MEPHQIIEACSKAPVSVRKEIAKLLKLDVVETIEDKLMNFGTIARSKSIPLYYDTPSGTDPDIIKLLPNAIVSTSPTPQGKWKNADALLNGTTEEEMLETAVKMSLFHAIDTFTNMITTFVIQTHREIFIKETDTDGNHFKLVCSLYAGEGLRLYLDEFNPSGWSGAGCAWLQQQ